MKKKSMKILSSMAILSLVVACGSESESKKKGPAIARQVEEAAPVDGSNIDGHYQAKFITLNPHVNGTIPGSGNFFRKEEKLFAYVRLFAGGVKAWHQQFVYTGSRCPTMKDDSNGDGFIDILEAEAVLGKILIPMDSDISSQSAGRRFFPLADLSGYYHYERITSFRRFLEDLQEEDKDLTDDTVKLGPGEGLRIVGKTFMVLGVTETVELPETVGTKGRFRAFQNLPIACGVFEKVTETPGDPYVQDEIPGPVAEVEEGQDRPAEDEIPSTTGGSTGGSSGGTTGSNDSDDGDGPVSDGQGRTSGPTGSSSDDDRNEDNSGRTTSGRTGPSSGRTSPGTTTGESDTGNGSTPTTGTNETTGSSSSGTSSSESSSSSSSTTTGGVSSSSTSTTTGTTTGGFLDSSSGV